VCGLVAGPNGGTCSDGLACTTGDTCNGGICQPTGAVTCTPTGSVCSVNACQEPSGTCAVTNAPSTTTCSDGLLCTTGDHCNGSGTCAGTQITCPSGDACYETGSTAGTCVAQQCSYPILNGIGGGTTTLWSTGKFYTAVNFGANTISNTGSADMFLNKLDPTTGKAIASFDLGVPPTGGGDQIGAGVSVDKNNNALVIGSYSNKVQFTASGNTQGVNVLKDVASVSGTAMNFFMVVNGTSSNATSAPYIVPVKGQSVDVGSGALIATASNPNVNGFAFCGKTSIGDLGVGIGNNGVTTGGATNGGGVDIIVAFVNDDGSIKWGQQYGGAGDQQCTAIAVDGSGNVYITGTNGGDLTQFGSSFIASGSGVAVPYVAVLNAADGTVKKAATWGTTGNNAANSIATDGTQVYVGGALGANIAFGGVSLTDSGLTDAYIVKMDAATLTPSCGVSLGDAANDQAVKGLGLDPTGATLYVGGIFSGTLSPTTLVSTGGSLDAFTMEFGTANCSINSCLKQITEDPAYYPGVPAGTQTVGMVAMQGSTMANWWIGGSYSSSMALGAGATAVSLPPTGSAGTIWYYVAHLLP
jgi:hypothetical protein